MIFPRILQWEKTQFFRVFTQSSKNNAFTVRDSYPNLRNTYVMHKTTYPNLRFRTFIFGP